MVTTGSVPVRCTGAGYKRLHMVTQGYNQFLTSAVLVTKGYLGLHRVTTGSIPGGAPAAAAIFDYF